MTSAIVARQPIFELGRGLFGYELLYRRDETADRADGRASHMTADVLISSALAIGLSTLTDGHVAFINFSRAELVDETWTLLDPRAVVIELLETIEGDDETLAVCRR